MFKIAICENQGPVLDEIGNILKASPLGALVYIENYNSGESLCEAVRVGKLFDLYILSIELQSSTGVMVANTLRCVLCQTEAHILFISIDSKYAMELFEYRPLNFLVKPLDPQKVIECVSSAMMLDERGSATLFEFFIKKARYSILYSNIRYFESTGKYVLIHTVHDDRQYIGTISEVKGTLLPASFIQIHKSYIVNLEYVRKQSYTKMVLDNDCVLNVSHSFRNAVRDHGLKIRSTLRGE